MRDPMPRWLTDPNHGKYAASKRHELRLAEAVGGARLPNSGGARRSKWDQRRSQGGDFENDDFLVEHKRTSKKSITIKLEWLQKVIDGAEELRKHPALIVTFEDHDEALDLVVVRRVDLQRAAERLFRSEEER